MGIIRGGTTEGSGLPCILGRVAIPVLVSALVVGCGSA